MMTRAASMIAAASPRRTLLQMIEHVARRPGPTVGLLSRRRECLLDHVERHLGHGRVRRQQFQHVVRAGDHVDRVLGFHRPLPMKARVPSGAFRWASQGLSISTTRFPLSRP
jgi:hypothetical protein